MDWFLNGLLLLLRFSTLPEHSECLKNVACKNERRRPCFFIWKQICNIVNFIRSLFLWCNFKEKRHQWGLLSFSENVLHWRSILLNIHIRQRQIKLKHTSKAPQNRKNELQNQCKNELPLKIIITRRVWHDFKILHSV